MTERRTVCSTSAAVSYTTARRLLITKLTTRLWEPRIYFIAICIMPANETILSFKLSVRAGSAVPQVGCLLDCRANRRVLHANRPFLRVHQDPQSHESDSESFKKISDLQVKGSVLSNIYVCLNLEQPTRSAKEHQPQPRF